MNKTIIIGNLTKDPAKYATTSGKNLTKFTVAVNGRGARGQEETTYFTVTAWEKLGENCASYLSKGSKVCVTGEVGVYAYTKDGEAVGTLTLTAHTVEFLNKVKKEDDFGSMPDSDAELPWE